VAGGRVFALRVLSRCPVLNTAAPVVQTVGGCWPSCSPVLNSAAPVVQTAGGMLVCMV